MKKALDACASGAVWRNLGETGGWQVDGDLFKGYPSSFIRANTARALEKRGLVKISQAQKINDFRRVRGLGPMTVQTLVPKE